VKEKQNQSKSAAPASPWQKTSFANLVRYEPSGTYFARVKVGGKLIRKSLETKVLSVAKLKLADLEKAERGKLESAERVTGGRATVGDLIHEYRNRLAADPTIKPRTVTYRQECIARITKSWPELTATDVRKLTERHCEEWAGRFKETCKGASSFNNTVGTLRLILEIAVASGARYTNPAMKIGRKPVRNKNLALPSQDQFHELLEEIRRVPFGPGLAAAELVEFLAYGGFRKSEAANVRWRDCDFERGKIFVRGDEATATKNGESRHVPMIPDMRALLERLKRQRGDAQPDDLVMRVRECQGTLTRACAARGIPRFTHHDLRHLFATRCIEAGVDIPTVSRWLGHKDGGALAMKVYGHLRDQHSARMAATVTFARTQPENVVALQNKEAA
jgi:integrase